MIRPHELVSNSSINPARSREKQDLSTYWQSIATHASSKLMGKFDENELNDGKLAHTCQISIFVYVCVFVKASVNLWHVVILLLPLTQTALKLSSKISKQNLYTCGDANVPAKAIQCSI